MIDRAKIEEFAQKYNMTIEQAEKSIETTVHMMEEKERKIQFCGSDTYLKWLYQFIEIGKVYDDETALYSMQDGNDKDMLLMISYLQEYVNRQAEFQKIENILDENNEFQIYNYLFKYQDRFYRIDTMVGQGALTFIECIGIQIDNNNFVKL